MGSLVTVKTAPYFVTRPVTQFGLGVSNAVWAKTSPRPTSRARESAYHVVVHLCPSTFRHSVFNDHQESYRLQCHTAGSSITYQKVQNCLMQPKQILR